MAPTRAQPNRLEGGGRGRRGGGGDSTIPGILTLRSASPCLLKVPFVVKSWLNHGALAVWGTLHDDKFTLQEFSAQAPAQD